MMGENHWRVIGTYPLSPCQTIPPIPPHPPHENPFPPANPPPRPCDTRSPPDSGSRVILGPETNPRSPICFEDLGESSLHDTVFCKAMCGNNIHKECFNQWARSKRQEHVEVTCGTSPLCPSAFSPPSAHLPCLRFLPPSRHHHPHALFVLSLTTSACPSMLSYCFYTCRNLVSRESDS